MINKQQNLFQIGTSGNTALLRDQVYHTLKEDILLGEMKPGNPLNINEIAKRMDISCAPVREAINLLSKDGLVEISPHRRAIVASCSNEDFTIIVEMRKRFEPFIAKMSTPLIPQDVIDEMRERLFFILDNPKEVEAYVASDIAIHRMLHCYYGSKILEDIMSLLTNLRICFSGERMLDDEMEKASYRIQSTSEHLRILEAINSRNPDLVHDCVLAHLEKFDERNAVYFEP